MSGDVLNTTFILWEIEQDLENNDEDGNGSINGSDLGPFQSEDEAASSLFASCVQQLTVHLWLVVPVVLLLIPPDTQAFFRRQIGLFTKGQKSSGERPTSQLATKLQNLQPRTAKPSQLLDFERAQLRYPFIACVAILASSLWGFLWALISLYYPDINTLLPAVIFWTSVGIVLGALRLLNLLCLWKSHKFDPEIEMLYTELCVPFRLGRRDFSKVLSSMREVAILKPGHDYVTEKMTPVDTLSLVLSGRLLVSQSGKLLHLVQRHHFVDSPEWFGVAADDFFQISATALEETKILVWHRDKLKLTLLEEPFLNTVFEHIIARDVVQKLTQTNDGSCLDVPEPQNPHVEAGLSQCSEEFGTRPETFGRPDRTKNVVVPMSTSRNSCVKANGHVTLLEEPDPSTWTLSRISEKEEEEAISPV